MPTKMFAAVPRPTAPLTPNGFCSALAKTRTGTAVGVILIIQGVLLAVFAALNFAEPFGSTDFVDDFERWFSFGFATFLAVIGAVLAFLLHRYQWWWVVIVLAILGIADLLFRVANLALGGAAITTLIFAAIEFVAVVGMIRGRRVLKAMKSAQVDPTVFE